jgi:hypothetical protein
MLGLCLSAATAPAVDAPVTFSVKPAVKKDGVNATINFTVSAPIDVEVAILDAKGVVVRHLAAGVIGSTNLPPAPLTPGLSQSITWDGRDDYGEQVSGFRVQAGTPSSPNPEPRALPPFSVRVRAGMGVKLEKIAGGDPYAFWSDQSGQGDHTQWRVTGLEVKSDGQVYLFGAITPHGLPALRQYDARGNYRRTVFPLPAGKPLEDVQGWGVNARADGTYTLRANYGWMSTLPAWSVLCGGRDSGGLWLGRLIPTPAKDTLCVASHHTHGNQQVMFGTDGTLRQPAPGVILGGEPLPQKGLIDPFFSALAPDGKSLYVSGLTTGTNGFWRDGQVWKVDLATRSSSVFFALGEEERRDRAAIGHSDANPYSAFQGVAVDADGRVFVCDRQNKRVAVLDKTGKLIRSVPVVNPDAVAINPKSKAIYVTTRFGNYSGSGELKLLKFADWSKDDAPAITLALRGRIGTRKESSLLTVVEDHSEILVWVAYTQLPVRIYKDTGAGLELVKDFYEAGPQRALDLHHMTIDPKTGDAYIADSQGFLFRVRDWKNPQFEPCMLDAQKRLNASCIAIDARSRHLYTVGHYRDPVRRWAMDGEFFTPVPASGSNEVVSPITCAWVFTGLWRRGMAVAPGGAGLAALGVWIEKGSRIDDYSGPLFYFKSDPAGLPWPGRRFSGFGGKSPESGGIQFDLQGNLYAGLADGKPNHVPPGLEKDQDFMRTTKRIYKFAPTGSLASGDLFPTEPTAPAKVYDVHCGSLSHAPRFGVDGYGRIYYPTGLLPQVSVIDNEGNRILAFGTYGNRDSLGGLPGDLVPTKDIPTAWPNSVDATDDHIYVSDTLNVRLMRLAKVFAVVEMAAIK